MQPKTYTIPAWLLLVIAFAIGWTVWYFTYTARNDIPAAETQKQNLQNTIDSLSDKRTQVSNELIKNSNSQVKKSNDLIKTLPNEKPIIRDTTYAAMSEYITNYDPNR